MHHSVLVVDIMINFLQKDLNYLLTIIELTFSFLVFSSFGFFFLCTFFLYTKQQRKIYIQNSKISLSSISFLGVNATSFFFFLFWFAKMIVLLILKYASYISHNCYHVTLRTPSLYPKESNKCTWRLSQLAINKAEYNIIPLRLKYSWLN